MIKPSSTLPDQKDASDPLAGSPQATAAGQKSGIYPQLLNWVEEEQIGHLLADPHCWLQPKHQGQRRLLAKHGSTIIGIDRNGLTATLAQPIPEDALRCGSNFILDGAAMEDRFVAFDLLKLGHQDLRAHPYLERYLLLMHLLSCWERRHVRIIQSSCVDGEKRRVFDELKASGAEAVVFRKIDEPYREGRAVGGPALKYRFHRTSAFVVCRHNEGRSVNLVLLDNGVVRNAGRVNIPPHHQVPEVGKVVEVRYRDALKDSSQILQPVFVGPRDDLTIQNCVVEQLRSGAKPVGDAA